MHTRVRVSRGELTRDFLPNGRVKKKKYRKIRRKKRTGGEGGIRDRDERNGHVSDENANRSSRIYGGRNDKIYDDLPVKKSRLRIVIIITLWADIIGGTD